DNVDRGVGDPAEERERDDEQGDLGLCRHGHKPDLAMAAMIKLPLRKETVEPIPDAGERTFRHRRPPPHFPTWSPNTQGLFHSIAPTKASEQPRVSRKFNEMLGL